MNSSNSEATCKKIQNYIFKFADLLGQGNFSKVYKAHNQLSNQTVAIKIVQLNSLKSKKLQQLLFSQIQVLKKLKHENILCCHEVFTSNRNCYIITQLCNQGDLQSKLRGVRTFTQDKALPIIKDIYLGLEYLADKNVIHRDLKIANIFMHNGRAKIADFGFAKFTKSKFKDINIGSPIYMSPQGLIQNIYGPKTDIWAFGIMIYQLLHGQTPFSHCKTQSQLKYSISIPIGWTKFKSQLSSQIKQLMLKCLQIKQDKRYTISQLKQLPFIQKILKQQYHEYNNNVNESDFTDKFIMSELNKIKPFQEYKQEKYSTNNSINKLNNFNQTNNNTKNHNQKPESGKRGMFTKAMREKFAAKSLLNNQSENNKQEKSRRLQQQANYLKGNYSVIQSKGNTNYPYLSNQKLPSSKYPQQSKTKDQFSPYGYGKNSNQKSFSSPSSSNNNKILSANVNFKSSVNILHYCRLIYKYISISASLRLKVMDENQRSILIRWLAILVKIINTRIQNRQIIYQGQNAALREQKLKEVSKQYEKKYSRQLNLNMAKINPEDYTIANYDYMVTYFQYRLQDTLSLLNNNKQNKQYKSLVLLSHYIVMIHQATKVLKKCYNMRKYQSFQQYRDIQNLLNMKKQQMDQLSLWNLKAKYTKQQ